jgi:TetR/AcrR family transcriptional regulator
MTLTSKEKIIKAAIKVFSAKGYDGATLDEIAQAARLTKPMIYYHFKNKKDLYWYLLESYTERFYNRLQDILTAPRDHLQILSLLIDYYDETFRTSPEMIQLYQRETVGHGRFLEQLTERYLSKMQEQLAAFFRDGARAGAFRSSLNYDLCAMTLAAIIMFHYSQGRVIQQLSKTADAQIVTTEAIHSHIMNLFTAQSEGSTEPITNNFKQ